MCIIPVNNENANSLQVLRKIRGFTGENYLSLWKGVKMPKYYKSIYLMKREQARLHMVVESAREVSFWFIENINY